MKGEIFNHNPFHTLNQLCNEFFSHIFPARCYDGVLSWILCDCFLKYQETVNVITSSKRLKFSFDNVTVRKTKSEATSELEKCMKDCLSLFEEYNRKRRTFFDHRNLGEAIYLTEEIFWEEYYHDLEHGRVFHLEEALMMWILEQEAEISPEVQAACNQRQSELESYSFKVDSLLQYVTWRTGIRRRELDSVRKKRKLPFVKNTGNWIGKFIEIYEDVKNVPLARGERNERLEYLCHDLYSIAKAFSEPLLLDLLSRYLEYNENLKMHENANKLRMNCVAMNSISVVKINETTRRKHFKFMKGTKILEFSLRDIVVEMSLSLPCEVSIPHFQVKTQLYILDEAATYRFVYPLEMKKYKEIESQMDGIDNELGALFSSGGFLYFDKKGEIISLTGIRVTSLETATLISNGPYATSMNPKVAECFKFHSYAPSVFEIDPKFVAACEICWIPPKILSLDDNGSFLMKVHRRAIGNMGKEIKEVSYEFCRLSYMSQEDYSQTSVLHREREFQQQLCLLKESFL